MKKFTAFVLGGGIGAGAMYLFAPRPGAESRQRVWGKVDATLDSWSSEIVPPEEAADEEAPVEVEPAEEEVFGEETVVAEAAEPVSEEPAAEEPEVSEAHEIPHKSEAADKADELLERINAVRKRIVAQTLANVSESLDAVSSVVEDARAHAAGIKEDVAEVAERAVERAEQVAEGFVDRAEDVAEDVVEFVAEKADNQE